jgi:GGDEF domain-containing protein
MLQGAPWGMALLRDGVLVWLNPRLQAYLQAMQAGADALLNWPDSPSGLIEIPLADGETLCLRRRLQILPEGEALYCFEEVSELVRLGRENERLLAKLQALEGRDAETGLLSWDAVLRALEHQISRSRRYGNPLSAIRLILTPPPDMDDPHHTLKSLAQEFNALLRWTDQIGRVERGVFLLVLPETPLESAQLLAQELSNRRLALMARHGGWKVEAAATAWRKGDDARKLLQRLRLSSP